MSTDLLTERNVTADYPLSIPWLRRSRQRRTGPAFLKLGRMVRYRRADIEAYLDGQVVHTRDGQRPADLSREHSRSLRLGPETDPSPAD